MKKTYRILIVDDDELAVDTIKFMLKLAPFDSEITTISDGKSALDGIRREKPDVMILDLMLPEMSGQDVLKTLDEDPVFKGFPILVNSTSAELAWTKKEIQACKSLRVDIAPRPCGHEELIEKLQALIGNA